MKSFLRVFFQRGNESKASDVWPIIFYSQGSFKVLVYFTMLCNTQKKIPEEALKEKYYTCRTAEWRAVERIQSLSK